MVGAARRSWPDAHPGAAQLQAGLTHGHPTGWDETAAVLGRGAASSGDSDSIACLAGAFAGAALGMAAWPASWEGQIEYGPRLARLSSAWDSPRPE
jgi:hypothetical protein